VLSEAVQGGAASRPEPETTPLAPATPMSGGLTAEDQALLAALRESWFTGGPSELLEALPELVQQAPERSERRLALLDAFARLALDLVLAPGMAPRGEASESLVTLARALEREDSARLPNGSAVAIYAALMALVDEPLVGADLLMKAGDLPGVAAARLELSRRALYLLRKSAGPLKTDTSRQMLVSGLRFFRHLGEVLGMEARAVSDLLDGVAGQDGDAMRALEATLRQAEGSRAAQKGAGPALCQLACAAAATLCADEGPVTACQGRCIRTGAVRFSQATRPTPDPRWYCH